VGGTISNTNVNSNTVVSNLGTTNPAFVSDLRQDGSLMSTSMTELSYQLGQQTANSTLSISGNRGTFNAQPGANGVAVFNITAANLDSIGEIQFNRNGADTVIVNVSGSNVTLNDNFLGGTANLGEHVIWNFTDATDLTLTTAWGGSVLAPKATAHTYNYIQGSAVFGSLVQDGEMHVGTYAGSYVVPSDPQVPRPRRRRLRPPRPVAAAPVAAARAGPRCPNRACSSCSRWALAACCWVASAAANAPDHTGQTKKGEAASRRFALFCVSRKPDQSLPTRSTSAPSRASFSSSRS
jgi:choice-of-anchor A domain-containing protein